LKNEYVPIGGVPASGKLGDRFPSLNGGAGWGILPDGIFKLVPVLRGTEFSCRMEAGQYNGRSAKLFFGSDHYCPAFQK